MLERVVGIMFRAAYGREDNCSSSMAEGSTSSPATSVTGGQSSKAKQEGDIEIDNSNHVLVKIATLYAERLMNDICLVVGGVEYPAHRLILCASSEVFQVMLMNPSWSESHESRVVLQEPPSCAKIFGEFLRYFYTGQIRINHHSIMPVLVLADKYNVKDLITLCLNYMCHHIAHAAVHNQVVTWFQYTFSLGHYQVAQACENFVKWNFELVALLGCDFGNFQIEMLSRLLQQNDLVVQNEMTVYNCVVSWLDYQKRLLMLRQDVNVDEEMEAIVKQVMAHVRFPMMTPRQLAELLLFPLTSQYKEFFIERMAIGMSYHSDQTDRIQEVCQMDGGRQLFTPRLYTADKWSSLLTVENFTQIQPYYPQTLMFSSQAVFAEFAGDRTCDWVIDLYPKGVWFQKFFLIVWQGTVEVPESVLRTVRLSVTCKDPPAGVNGDDLRVKVGLLMMGMQDGVEHVMRVITRNHRFSEEDKVLNFDDVLSFDELNDFVATNNSQPSQSPFLVGENRNTLKINIVITPLNEVCSVENAEGFV